jgi:hypothetical protein
MVVGTAQDALFVRGPSQRYWSKIQVRLDPHATPETNHVVRHEHFGSGHYDHEKETSDNSQGASNIRQQLSPLTVTLVKFAISNS